jgi:hypothetical protein
LNQPYINRMVKSRKMRWVKTRKYIQEMTGAYWVLVSAQTAWGENLDTDRIILKIILKNTTGWHEKDSSGSGQGLVNTAVNLQIPQKAGNFFTSWATISYLLISLVTCVHVLFSNDVSTSKSKKHTAYKQLIKNTYVCHI